MLWETTSGITQELGAPLQHSPHQHCHSSHLCHGAVSPGMCALSTHHCLGAHPCPGTAPRNCHPWALLHVGSGKGLRAAGHSEMGKGQITAIPRSWEGEGRVKQSAERRGARRQPGYWKPRWAGSDWDGCGEKLRAPTALRPAQHQHCHPWVQPGPATSPTASPPSTGGANSQSWQPWESPTRGCQSAAWCQAR